MRTSGVIVGVIWIGMVTLFLDFQTRAAELSCFVCEQRITAMFFRIQDRAEGRLRDVCAECARRETRCMTCGLPVTDSSTRLADGRLICARDARTAVLTEEEIERLGRETLRELEPIFTRQIAFPAAGVTVAGADRLELEKIFKTPGYDQGCGSVFGATLSLARGRGAYAHSVRVLTGLPAARTMAVCAHEYGHTWIREQVPQTRALSADAVEGFCEWIAFRLMEARNDTNEMAIIRANPYSKGQVEAFAGADRIYGAAAVAAWMKQGEDDRLQTNQLERVLILRPGSPRPVDSTTAARPGTEIRKAPDQLVLQGTATTARRRMAMINDLAFEEGDEREVPLGDARVRVRCLKILDSAVQLRVGDNPSPITLKVHPR